MGIKKAADALGLPLDGSTVDRLADYVRLLTRWNSTYNLTALRSTGQVLSHHIADCLAVIKPLSRKIGDGAATLLDVGSGGGLPGVIIASLLPHVRVTCVDAVGKKAAFIRQVAAELRLSNLLAVHRRVEELDDRFDVVASRAFASLPDFISLTRARLSDRGLWMAMKAKPDAQELSALPNDVDVFHVEQITVPGLDAARCIVWMKQRLC